MLTLLLIPSNLYLTLAGGALGILSTYTLVLLFTYISRFLGADLTKQEVYALYYALFFSGVFFNAYSVVYRAYLRVSEVTNSFLIGGVPVARLLPTWFAPPAGSPAFKLRTLFHPDMALPLLVPLMISVLGLMAELSMVMLTSFLFVEVESLPYPLAQVDAAFITMIADRPAEWLRGFLPAVGLTLFLAVLIYLPSIGALVGVVPVIGFHDLTPQITDILPGAAFGINFQPGIILTGFMIPFEVATAALVTSLVVWVFLNSLIITHPFFRSWFPDWAKEYYKGMSYVVIVDRSTLRVWAPIQLGAQLALSVLLVARYRREIARAFSALAKAGSAGARDYPPLPVLLAMFFAASGLAAILYSLLLPGIPIYVVTAITMGLGLLIPLTNAYMAGKAGPGLGIPPYTWHSVVYSMIGQIPASTQVTAILFGPPIIGGMAGNGARAVKVASLVGAKPTDLVKVVVLAFVIGTFVNLLVVDAMWRLAPIPSMAYPSTVGMRDAAVNDCVVASGVLPLKPHVILPAMGFFLLLFAALESLSVMFRLPLSIAGVTMGLTTTPAWTVVYFISSLIANVIVPKLMGRERASRWGSYKGVLIAGATLGDGLAATAFTLLGLIGRASWTWPW
jgi:hypothetical protein